MRALALGSLLAVAVAGCSDGEGAQMPDGAVENDGSSCLPTPLERAEADWLLLVDHSGTWVARADRWAGLGDALGTFLDEQAGAQLALSAFPRTAGDCAAASYEALDLPWGTTAATVKATVGGLTLAGDSPLGPALAGATVAARAHQALDRRRATSIVLLTDAAPGEDAACQSSEWTAAAALAAAAFDRGLGDSVAVHLVSVIGTASDPNHGPLVGGIADAGGGYVAVVNGSRSDVARSALTALRDVHALTTACKLVLPAGVRPDALELVFPDGTSERPTRVADADACAGAGAAFYVDDPENPTLATLCRGGPVGGFCQLMALRARSAGAPTVRALCP